MSIIFVDIYLRLLKKEIDRYIDRFTHCYNIYIILEIYLRRFKKEKRLRRKVQDQLEMESIKKAKLEEALSSVSYQTFLQLKEES